MEILVIVLIIGSIPGAIAQSKGRSFVGWWLYGAALFIIALPHSLLLRRRDQPQAPIPVVITEGLVARPVRSVSDPTPRPMPVTTKTCPMCAESVQAAARICRFCRYDFGEPAPPTVTGQVVRPRLQRTPYGMKACPSCGENNWHDAAKSSNCGVAFPPKN